MQNESLKIMMNTYTLINKFECCGKAMVTVIIDSREVCVMSKLEYNRIIETEQKYIKSNGYRVA